MSNLNSYQDLLTVRFEDIFDTEQQPKEVLPWMDDLDEDLNEEDNAGKKPVSRPKGGRRNSRIDRQATEA